MMTRHSCSSTRLLLGLFILTTTTPSTLAQNSTPTVSVPYSTTSCLSSQFFDTSNLKCTACPVGYFPTANKLSCQQCDTSGGFFYDTIDGFGTSMTWLASSSPSTCSCSSSTAATISATVKASGTFLQRCIQCPAGYTVGQSSSGESACIPPAGTAYSTTSSNQQQFQKAMTILGTSFSYAAATTASFPSSAVGQTASVSSSYALSQYIGPAALDCASGANDRSGCNAVANLCVLQLYSLSSPACQLYNSLVAKLATSDNTNAIAPSKPNTGPLPWLYYQGSSYSNATDVNLNFQMRGSSLDLSLSATETQTISVLTIVLSAYALNGTWLGYRNMTKQFQICGTDKVEASNWLNFGWDYRNACQIDLEDVLMELQDGYPDTALYDIFLQNGVNSLYPIPVKITNYLVGGVAGNSQNDPTQGAVRRFFYVDGSMGRVLNADDSIGPQQVLQYPTKMRLVFTLQTSPRNQIFPPLFLITYSARTVGVSPGVTEDASFEVSYINNPDLVHVFWYAWQVILIVIMTVIAFPMLVWKGFMLSRRRRGSEQADQEFLFSGALAIADIGSWGLTLVLLLVTLYYLILYKLQNSVFYMMVDDDDLYNFKITVYLAVVGQTVGVLNMIYEQTKMDVFMLDWEKPRKVLTTEGNKEEAAPVNCWRTLLLANEFNELQTKRITSTGFTLLMLSLILTGQDVIASADITPYGRDYTVYRNNVQSLILRFGTEAAFFLVLFLGQFVLIRILYFRYVSNPVSNFIDLAYLANISIFIFDERHSGYYIHGRNSAQHADTDLTNLNNDLIKEEEGLQGERGLVTTYDGNNAQRLNQNQIFNVFITNELRNTYESKMLRLIAQSMEAARMRRNYASILLSGPGKTADGGKLSSQQEIAGIFKQMIDDAQRNYATQVIDPTYFQMVTRLPPLAAASQPVFVHDYFNSFTSTMLIGNDLRMFVYEALFFCTIDCLALNNVASSAFITYVVSMFLKWVRRRMGENNLASKTLVDPHFLV